MTELKACLLLWVVVFISCKIHSSTINETSHYNEGEIIDQRDNKTYKIVFIGNQLWFKENLNYHSPDSKSYNNKKKNTHKLGRLYGVEELDFICPKG